MVTTKKAHLIGLNLVEDLLETILWSGYLKNEKPISALIIADVESGKTELVKEYALVDGIAYTTDATAFGIVQKYGTRLKDGKIRHIVIPDMLNPLSRRKSTVDGFIMFMNSLIEEGVFSISTFNFQVNEPIAPIGFIGCITKDKFQDKKKSLMKVGFVSRCLPISYSYSIDTIYKIFNSIVRKEYIKYTPAPKDKFKFEKKEVKISKHYCEKTLQITQTLIKTAQLYGFRLQKHLQILLQAIALKRAKGKGNIEVREEDFKKLVEFAEFINFNFCKL